MSEISVQCFSKKYLLEKKLRLLAYGRIVKKKKKGSAKINITDLKHLITTSVSRTKTLPAQFHRHQGPPSEEEGDCLVQF